MKDRYVIDTNVLIAASAADPGSPSDIDATPDDPSLRLKVLEWLSDFHESTSRLILDSELKIFSEYNNKLGHADFGIQVVMSKWSQDAVDSVNVVYDSDGNGVLPESLMRVIHDLADRKMVAASLASHADFGEGCVAFAGDTDWHDWERELAEHDVLLEPIIEDWSRAKHAEKKLKK
jgi:predicted nucleic acid-binding protein